VPFMPQFTHLSDTDIQNIIAYLRSDAPELAPSDVAQPAAQSSFVAKLLCRTVMKPKPYPTQAIPDPPTDNAVALGKYLVTAKLDCYGCHSPSFMNINSEFPEKTPGYLSGGNELLDEESKPILSLNITPDKETGIGNWTEEQFVKAIKTGIRPQGPAMRFPMTPFTALTDEEAKAIWAYLQTVPAIKHEEGKLDNNP
jgi:cytochrome c1